ncbi:ATP-binding protein [Sphingomonas sp. MMS12-HWE2-04]|uniref:sensor histidine kinase n=1 Tax=Sphingomonas sp. MMS12-HWE2-04 TaxID=3234199 RepID=UPI00384F415C
MSPVPPTQAQSQLSFARKLVGLVILGFLSLIAAAVATAWVQSRNEASSALVQHTLQVEARLGQFTSAIERVETARRGIMLGGGPDFRARMEESATVAVATLDQLHALTSDNPHQQSRIAALRKIMTEQQAIRARTSALTTAQSRAFAGQDFATDPGVQLTRRARRVAEAMLAEERGLLEQRDQEQVRALRTFYGILLATGVLLVLTGAVTVTIMLRYTRELAQSREELRRFNEDLEGIVGERTSELQRANDEIQRFAYIVSHDLRSPLVNVMGFTAELDAARKTVAAYLDKLAETHPDLIDAPIRLAVSEDLPEAIGFIRTSTQKMDRLINAILRLSREGRRTLAPERVDADALIASIVGSIQHRVSDAGAEIVADPLPEIVTDRLALEQILSNLIENAVKYLQPGRPGIIKVRGRRERDRIVYEVIDNGRGVDPRDHERIFDLFRRSGVQDQAGEGIGLAHVRALAYRLGGLIEVRSELDRGSTFRLSLPIHLSGGGNGQ